jgi:ABC-type multidrug transport system fused ATPase/permease subunit
MWNVIKLKFKIYSQQKGKFALYILMGVVLVCFGVAQPYIYKLAIDGFVNIFDSQTPAPPIPVLNLIIIWLVISYTGHLIDSLKEWFYWHQLSNPTYIAYLRKAYTQVLKFDYDFFVQKKSGELMKTLDDGLEAYGSLGHIFFEQLLQPSISFFALLIFAWFQSKELTIVCLVIIPIHALWAYYNYRRAAIYSKKARDSWHKLFGHIGDVLNNILTTKSFQQEKRELEAVEHLSSTAIKNQRKRDSVWLLFELVDMNTVSQGAIILLGYILIKNEQATIGTVLMFNSILSQLLVPVRMIKGNIRAIQTSTVQSNKLAEMLAEIPKIQSPENGHSQKNVAGRLVFKNVSFHYSNNAQVLANIDLTIEPGEKVALVGHSGAGKSTLALLLMRFYDVTKGAIHLDGVDIRSWDYDNLRSHFGVVWQENMLFHDSIINNIRYGSPDASVSAVEAAAKQAYAHKYIMELPQKYQSVVGERGIRLSGGEKQRVAIARALLKNPRIVILDEATSALDSITEREVQKGILNLIKDRTAIIIAHRLSTVQHCDKIVVLEHGKIIAIGKHSELLKKNKQYKEMVDLQANGFFPVG